MNYIFSFDAQHPLLFTQFYFWAFFAIVFSLFALIIGRGKSSRGRMHLRNIFLLFVSWFFYYKTSGVFLWILVFVTISNFYLAKAIRHYQELSTIKLDGYSKLYTLNSKLLLCLSIIIDLAFLGYFKYAYFGADVVNSLFGTDWHIVDKIVLPVGISFYIFQVISYSSDVYHRRIEPVKNILDFGFYVAFFPQLVAGPIVRASEFIPQLYKPWHLTKRQFGIAIFWILNGLTKKIVLSDYLAVNFIDRVFQSPTLFTGFENLMALFTYSMQVYADFSGYTDIAIGVAMLMGFYLPQNFDSPYKAQNPQEFWRRWHISLSRWLKTYVYIPLGGNRNATFGTYFWIALFALIAMVLTHSWIASSIILGLAAIVIVVALVCPNHRKLLYTNLNSFITMLLGGLWHGASWNFMIWGGLNGIGMIINKFWRIMGWHLRMAVMTAITVGLVIGHHYYPAPLMNLAYVWFLILWVGTAIRYIYNLLSQLSTAKLDGYSTLYTLNSKLSTAWAIAQTFAFISFTRLFFRSSSNLDPALENEQAWKTAKEMVGQIGGAWSSSIIPDFLWEYRYVMIVFVVGMIIHWLPTRWKRWYRLNFAMLPTWAIMIAVIVVVAVVYQFITAEQQPFIYFQF
ncbi:MAG: MBOAT family protein [Paludibacteraceae bacterium]|nr:MBOAT family protein [Paludibacteraceae bacterium]